MRRNWMLPTGLCLLGLLLLGALLGPQLALFPPGYHDNLIYLDTDQGRELFVSPVAPQKPHYLGTDPWGYDLLSLMLHGLQYSLVTVVVVAMLRVLLALAVVGAGAGGLHTSRVWGGLNAIPQFVIIYFILYNINFNSQLGSWELSAIQWILLILFGIPALVPSVAASLEELEQREFVTVARATGAGPARRFFVHILPHLWERLLLVFSRETTAVLTLVGQLGIFNIFIGGTVFTPHPTLYHSKTHEWAGLLGQYRGRIHGDAWWVAVFPLLGFMLLLLGCYLTSRGLQRKLQDTYHSVSHL